ncbi:transposase [Streptomyces sp. NPDC058295]|uniref:transposase n=1 Tax=Streptomyces sp. NPDC058295 TaxID=3346431 RepID=UPI0036E96F5B
MRGRDGRPEGHCHRAVLDAIRYLVDNGDKWRAIPADFPPWDRGVRVLPPLARPCAGEGVTRPAARAGAREAGPGCRAVGGGDRLAVGQGGRRRRLPSMLCCRRTPCDGRGVMTDPPGPRSGGSASCASRCGAHRILHGISERPCCSSVM